MEEFDATTTALLDEGLRRALNGLDVRCLHPLTMEMPRMIDLLRVRADLLRIHIDSVPVRGWTSRHLAMARHLLCAYACQREQRLLVVDDRRPVGRLARLSPRGRIILVPSPDPFCAPRELLPAINALRDEQGLAQLVPSVPLARAAEKHCNDLATRRSLSHAGSDGTLPLHRAYLQACRFREVYETTVQGSWDAAEILRHWCLSMTHRQILLTPGLREVGISRVRINLAREPVLVAVYGGGPPRRWARRMYSHLLRITGLR